MDNEQKLSLFVESTISLLIELRIIHWRTRSYASHKAYDGIHADLSALLDKFVEVSQGEMEEVLNLDDNHRLIFKNVSDTQMKENMKNYKKVLNSDEFRDGYSSEINNIIDEIVAVIDQGIYLLSLS